MRISCVSVVLPLAMAALMPPHLGAWQVTQPFVGITYSAKAEAQPRQLRMHVAQIDLSAPGLRFKVSPPGGDREVLRQSTLDYLIQERAQLAINAHYFPSLPVRG